METALYKDSGSLLKDAQGIIEQARQEAYRSVNIAMLQRNWLLGKRISEEILRGENRAEYGNEVIKKLSEELTDIYGKGFNKNNLYAFVQFYKIFPTLSGKSELLSWSHYMLLLSVPEDTARNWYAHEAYAETWSVRTLRRNIASQYYYRLLQSQNKTVVENEMKSITAPMQNDKSEFIKNPVVAEFLGLASNTDFSESQLEGCIISHLQKFIMELGKVMLLWHVSSISTPIWVIFISTLCFTTIY